MKPTTPWFLLALTYPHDWVPPAKADLKRLGRAWGMRALSVASVPDLGMTVAECIGRHPDAAGFVPLGGRSIEEQTKVSRK